MAHSAGGMSVFFLLCALSATATATLSITQGRVLFNEETDSDAGIERFEVVGVATVQIGGQNQPSYFFECVTTGSDRSGLLWSRETTVFAQDTQDGLDGLRLNMAEIEYGDLDVYICSDSNTGEMVRLNITDANPAACAVEDKVSTSEGLAVQLKVYVSGYPLIMSNQIKWFRPNGAEILEDDVNARFANSRKTLILSSIALADAGTYIAEVSRVITSLLTIRAQAGVDLVVQVAPTITVQPVTTLTVTERESFSLTCTASGNPPPSITWLREDGVMLNPQATTPSQSITDIFLTNVTSTLMVPSSLYTDMGRYQCSADSTISQQPVLSDYAEVTVRPILTLSAMNTATNQPISFTDVISQPLGSEFTVTCVGSGDLMWTSSTGSEIPFDQTGNLYQTLDITSGRLTLTFSSFNASEIAVYTCETPLTDINNVPIIESIFITNTDPAVFITPTVLYVLEGGSISIEAGIFASSTPTVQWYHGGQLLNIANDPMIIQTVEENLYILTISPVTSQRLGEYNVEVSLGGSTVMDSVTLSYPTPPTVSVSPTQLTVTEGEEVRVQCERSGVGVVNSRWFYGEGGSLPSGVIQNDTELVISSVTSEHNGTYQCSASNLAATVTDTVDITVRYRPSSVIRYNQISSTSNQLLSVTFDHNTVAPIFMCTSSGYPAPQVLWRVTGGGDFPNGVTTQAGGRELVWRRSMEYTDSGMYECVSENELGESVATLDLTVQFSPIIDSIYRSNAIDISDNGGYLVPSGFTGIVLTCSAFAWPPPYVDWLYKSNPLPDGVQVSTTVNMGSVSAKLIFNVGFNSTYNGQYQCVVKETESSSIVSRVRNEMLTETGSVTSTPPPTCSVTTEEVNFQIRILNTDCESWTPSQRESIGSAFPNELARIIRMECSCDVSESYLEILNTPVCSTKVDNGVVIRGTVRTNSVAETEEIYCALSDWQQTSPLVNINSQLFQVDAGCSLLVDSFSSPECVSSTTTGPNEQTTLIIAIAVPTGVVVIIALVLLVICCAACCCCRCRNKDTWSPEGKQETFAQMSPYSRTDLRYGQHTHTVSPALEPGESPIYSTLNRPYHSQSATVLPSRPPMDNDSPQHLPLEPIGSLSRDCLIRADHEQLDGEIHFIHTETNIDNPTSSYGVSNRFPYESQSSSGASSRVTSPPNRPNVVSATNPISDYEELDYSPHFRGSSKASNSESMVGRRFSESSNSPTVLSATGPSYTIPEKDEIVSTSSRSGSQITQEPLSTASLRTFSRSSINPSNASPAASSSIGKPQSIVEEERRGSDCSEEPPPYSSRPSSGITPATSMLDNLNYARVEQPLTIDSEGGDQQWYMHNSDFSLDSTKSSRHELRGGTNGRTVEIPPYAMIHNSAIPYTPTSIRTQSEVSNSSPHSPRTLPTFRVDDHHRRQSTPQPYSEPIRSSLASISSQSNYGPPRENTMEMITV